MSDDVGRHIAHHFPGERVLLAKPNSIVERDGSRNLRPHLMPVVDRRGDDPPRPVLGGPPAFVRKKHRHDSAWNPGGGFLMAAPPVFRDLLGRLSDRLLWVESGHEHQLGSHPVISSITAKPA